mmetsp:Transcript_7677/g.14490  ORF Transcript_7677/g.14490 Transcript_7677/m.14490 type:complete len:300 (-) Transcript_7677:182-1081(-)
MREEQAKNKRLQPTEQKSRMEANLQALKQHMDTNQKSRSYKEAKQLTYSQSITTNINKAASFQFTVQPNKQYEAEEALHQLMQFLTSSGLERYFNLLVGHGVDDIETLTMLTDTHLIDLNIPLGHRIKLMKRINEARFGEPKKPPVQSSNMSIEMFTKCFEANSDYFKQALDQFRKGGSSSQRTPGAEGMTKSRSDKKITNPLKVRSAATMAGAMLIESKASCWNCFSLHVKSEGVKFDNRDFCSQECCEQYKADQLVSCLCEKKFSKVAGVLSNGRRYCSEACAHKSEEGPVDAFSCW